MIIPVTHIIIPKNSIQINISTGLTPSVLFIRVGINTLFSIHCITKYIPVTTKNQTHHSDILHTNIPGTAHINGHIYGIISVSQLISARDNLFGTDIQNTSNISNHIYTVTNINKHNNNCDFSQYHILVYIFLIFSDIVLLSVTLFIYDSIFS